MTIKKTNTKIPVIKPVQDETSESQLEPLTNTGDSRNFDQTKTLNPDDLASSENFVRDLSKYLVSFSERNKNTKHINHHIYYLLCNPYTFVNAYAKISKNKVALTKGINPEEETMFYFGKSNAKAIAQKFKTNSFTWSPVRRTMIPKPGKKKMRPIDTPTQEDRIVQEAIRGILEAIFEPEFAEFEEKTNFRSTNYGFRRNYSTFDAVSNLKKQAQRTNYGIKGDIVSAYNNVNHDILIGLIETRIRDKKFLKVIRDLLKSGVMDQGNLIHSLTGTPQGGIVSPLLFNIYLFPLDKFIFEEIISPIEQANASLKKIANPIHKNMGYKMKTLIKKWHESDKGPQAKEEFYKPFKKMEQERLKLPSALPSSLKKGAIFARYADDWLLLITCTEKEAESTKEKIKDFILTNLKMELDYDKTLISKLVHGIDFLGYTIKMWDNSQLKTTKKTHKTSTTITRMNARTTSRKVNIIPCKERILKNLFLKKFCNKEFYPIENRAYSALTEYEIVLKFSQIMQGLYIYYRFCDSHYVLNRVSYILQYSCAKTIAHRKKSSIRKVFQQYGPTLRVENVTLRNDGQLKTRFIEFETYTMLKAKKFANNKNLSLDPFYTTTNWRTKWKLFTYCCICNSSEDIAMHHINSLRSIKDREKDKNAYIRKSLNRLQIPVCRSCHNDITSGRYSGTSPIVFYNIAVAKL